MKQKVVSVLLALVMVLSLLPTAWAEIPAGAGGAAKLNDTVYETLEDAVRLAVSGDTITLLPYRGVWRQFCRAEERHAGRRRSCVGY